jgi:hypothetical protein
MTIFLSYCKEDSDFAHRVFWILHRMKLDPYAYLMYPEAGEIIPELTLSWISKSKYAIPFLTKNGVQSQWVNQEIGAALALKKYIIPVVEIGVESEGFVELRHCIDHNPVDPDETITNLLYRIRTLTNPNAIECTCAKCGNEFYMNLPSIKVIGETLAAKQIFTTNCPKCKEINLINPRTLEVYSP